MKTRDSRSKRTRTDRDPHHQSTAKTSGHDHSEAVENYAKAVYMLEQQSGGAVTTNALADRLSVTPASASSMVKRLDQLGLVAHVPYKGVKLTGRGRRLALEVLRHHRLLELYLTESLGVPWDRVHDEAEVLEHALSEELEEVIASRLGDPASDPHGHPIPSRELRIEEEQTQGLSGLEPGVSGVFVRISDHDPEMLRYLAERGITPGDRFEVVDRQPFDGPLSVRFGNETHVLGGGLARAMRVDTEGIQPSSDPAR